MRENVELFGWFGALLVIRRYHLLYESMRRLLVALGMRYHKNGETKRVGVVLEASK